MSVSGKHANFKDSSLFNDDGIGILDMTDKSSHSLKILQSRQQDHPTEADFFNPGNPDFIA